MKRTHITSWLALVGLLLVIGGSGLMQSLLDEYRTLGGPQGMNRMTLHVNTAKDTQGTAGLTVDDANKLLSKWGADGSYDTKITQSVVRDSVSVSSDVIGANASYPQFHQMWIKHGGFLTERALTEHSKVAVVSSEFADSMFGSQKVVGLEVEIWSQPFIIIGVYEKRTSILTTAADDSVPDVIIPASTLIDYSSKSLITSIDLAAKGDSRMNGDSNAASVLGAVGKSSSAFTIINGLKEQKLQDQKRNLVLLALGILSILFCLRIVIRQGTWITNHMRSEVVMKNWQDVLKDDWKRLFLQAIPGIAGIAGMIVLWIEVKTPIYIPADKLPDRFINLSFYWDLVKESWQNQADALGYIPTQPERLYAYASGWINTALIAFLPLGIPISLIGIREWKQLRFSGHTMIRLFCVNMILVIIATTAAEWGLGLPVIIDWKTVIIASVFLLLFVLQGSDVWKSAERRKKEIMYQT